MKENPKLYQELAEKMIKHMTELFQDESLVNHIDLQQVMKSQPDGANHFFHALGNLMPGFFYKHFSSDKTDLIGFNHVMNRMVMQYTEVKARDDKDDK